MGPDPVGPAPMTGVPEPGAADRAVPDAAGPAAGPKAAPDADATSAATPDRAYDADELDLQPYDPGPSAQDAPAQESGARAQHDADLEWLHSGWTDRDQAEHEEALRASGGSDFDRAYRSTEQQE